MTETRVIGTIGLENNLRQNPRRKQYDENGKKILKHKEVLAIILKYSLPEYENYSPSKIMTLIDTDSITQEEDIEPDSDSRIIGDDTVQSSYEETNLTFDVKFRVLLPEDEILPKEEQKDKKIHLHIDIELQSDYYPGYKIENRGIYNLCRMISNQLESINKRTNYDALEKAYCIFICVGNVPKYLSNTVSYYGITNTRNIGELKKTPRTPDLMELVVVRLGKLLDEESTDIVQFLHGVFYGHVKEVDKYIDFSQNEEFRKEIEGMSLSDGFIKYGRTLEQEKTKEEKARADQAEARANQEKMRAEQEKARAEQEKARAEQEKARAEQEKARADAEKAKSDKLQAELEEIRRMMKNEL